MGKGVPATAALQTLFDAVHSDALFGFAALVGDLGGDAPELLRRAGIAPAATGRDKPVIAYRALLDLFETAADQLAAPDFGLQLAQRQRGGKVFGPVGVVMRNSQTVGQALGYCAKHIHAYSLATRVAFKPNRAEHLLLLAVEILLDGVTSARQAMEHALLLATLNIVDMTGGAARARQIRFRHAPQLPLSVYRGYFGVEVLFEQEVDGIILTEDDLLCEITNRDEQVYDMACEYIDTRFPPTTPPIHAQVRALIVRYLGRGDSTFEKIAREMCMHPRTLQRRLRAEGASFELIKDDVRREVALRYLRQPHLPLIRVAEKLGYAEASVLSRSCQRWFEASPQQVRRVSAAAFGSLQTCAAR